MKYTVKHSDLSNIKEIVDKLVHAAQQNGKFYYTQTLLRVTGIELGDPFEVFRSQLVLNDPAYCDWIRHDDFLQFIWNLVQCSNGRPYNAFPFVNLSQNLPYGERSHITSDKVHALVNMAADSGQQLLSDWIAVAYPDDLLSDCSTAASNIPTDDSAITKARALNEALLIASDRERKAFPSSNRFAKWPRFEVLEILADEVIGLYGYRVHFSNGSSAEFTRRPEGTRAVNISFDDDGQINYWVGSLDELCKEWRVVDRRLHEIGLPGRYNKLGFWQPIVYEGPAKWIQDEIRQLSDDPEVQGSLFYIYTTAHWVIEFAVRANVDLPLENVAQFGSEDHPICLWKLPNDENKFANECLYDGWITLPTPTVGAIKIALTHIRIGMSRLAFAYDAELKWVLKYGMVQSVHGLATPTESDLERFDELLINPVAPKLDLAIGWYNAANNAADPLTGFLCYFNAIEVLIEGVWAGDIDLPSGPITKQSKSERRLWRRECVQQLYEALFPQDPERFAQEVYFNCLQQLAKRRRDVANAIWGLDNATVSELFDPTDDQPSFTEIRNRVAHGRASVLNPDDVILVKKSIGILADIAKECILRLLLKKMPNDSVQFWSRHYNLSMSMDNPRSTMVTSTIKILPSIDWRIRSDWIK